LAYPPARLVLRCFGGYQVIPPYGVCTFLIFGFAVAAIWLARLRSELAIAAFSDAWRST